MNKNISLEMVNAKLDSEKFYRVFKECQPLVDENLVENGGSLRHDNLIDRDYNWVFLFTAKISENIVGFSVVRFLDENQHNITDSGYYYISQIVVAKDYQHMGIGSLLLKNVLNSCNSFPVVASVRETNAASLHMLEKFMTPINQNKNFIRFVNKEFLVNLTDDAPKR